MKSVISSFVVRNLEFDLLESSLEFFDPSVVKFYVKVINIILFYKLKEGACKKGRVDSDESGVCEAYHHIIHSDYID